MRDKYLKMIGVSLICLSTVVHAEEWGTVVSIPVENEGRFAHFMLSIGRTDIQSDVFHHQGAITKLQGGYRFNDYIAIEIGFAYYQQTEDMAGTVEQEMTGAAFEGQLFFVIPLLHWCEPYGKLGASSWVFDVEEPSGVDSGTGTFEGNDIIYGGGFFFHVDHDSTLRLEYEMVNFKDSDFDMEAKQISFGIHHRF